MDKTMEPSSKNELDLIGPKPLPAQLNPEDVGELVHFGGNVDRSSVTLRIFGDALEPEKITQLLGSKPTKARRKGDIVPTKKYHRTASTGLWLLSGNLPETQDIEEHLLALLALVTNDLNIWKSLTQTYEVDIFCGVFLETCNRGFTLSPNIMKMLSERNIQIGFDIYAGESL